MNTLCWNCRGLGNPRAVNALRKWCAMYAPKLVFVSETMINSSMAENNKTKLGFNCSFGVSSIGKAGGLCVYWNSDDISFDLVSFSQNHICGEVTEGGVSWRLWGFMVGRAPLTSTKPGFFFETCARIILEPCLWEETLMKY